MISPPFEKCLSFSKKIFVFIFPVALYNAKQSNLDFTLSFNFRCKRSDPRIKNCKTKRTYFFSIKRDWSERLKLSVSAWKLSWNFNCSSVEIIFAYAVYISCKAREQSRFLKTAALSNNRCRTPCDLSKQARVYVNDKIKLVCWFSVNLAWKQWDRNIFSFLPSSESHFFLAERQVF